MDINFSNQSKSLCVICDKPIPKSNFTCLNCGKPCEVELLDIPKNQITVIDAKSKCCNSDFAQTFRSTCSDKCHEVFINEMIKEFGEFKHVIGPDGLDRKVPIVDIIEKGLQASELSQYPVWNNE